MELNKNNIKKLIGIITVSLLIFGGLNHFSVLLELLRGFLVIISPFLLGLCFAFLINVLMRKIEKVWDKMFQKKRGKVYQRIQRPACLFLSLLLIVGVIFVILFMIIPEFQKNIIAMWDMFPQYMNNVMEWWNSLTQALLKYSIVLPSMELNTEEIGKVIADFMSQGGALFLNRTMDITVSIVSTIVNAAVGLVFAVYVLLQKEKLSRQVKKLLFAVLPACRVDSVLELCSLTNKIFTSFVTGQLTEAVIIGTLCFLGMLLLRIPYAAVISVLVGFTALIPVFGAFLGTAVGAVLILVISPLKALEFVIFIIVLQQLEGNIIYPKVVGKSVGLPGIWVLAAVTAGGSMFGFMGMLFSVPVCSVLYCIVRQAVNHELDKKGIEIDE